MTELLADRVSYLLGNTNESRQHIRTSFCDLYDFRSKLLHGRASLTDENNHELKYALQTLAKDIFLKEFENYSK